MATASSPPSAPPYEFRQAPPQHAQPQFPSAQQKPAPSRKSRTFSFRSDKSRSSGSHKVDLRETPAEKEAKKLRTKADPTVAMQEAEPSEVAATVKSSLAPLRSIQHKDAFGNPIVEPDLSNPTRSRWERPLDTIRSFEAAIDGGYNNRRSIIRPDAEGATWGPNRRSSYVGGNGAGNRYSSYDGYYGSRPPSMMYTNRADASQYDPRMGGMGHRDSYYDQQPGYGYYGPSTPNGRRGWPRVPSEPQYGSAYRQQAPHDYPIPSNHRSYETVTTASGGGSSGEPAGYQTDPTSSDNSSIERVQSGPKRQTEPINDYGIGFSQSPTQQPMFTVGIPSGNTNGGGIGDYRAGGALNSGSNAPSVPQKNSSPVLRTPVTNDQAQKRPPQPEKRKSWFARRFSKHR